MARKLEDNVITSVEDLQIQQTDAEISNVLETPVEIPDADLRQRIIQLETILGKSQTDNRLLTELYEQVLRTNAALNSENQRLADENTTKKEQNDSLTNENSNLLNEVSFLNSELEEAKKPYSNEKEVLRELGSLTLSTNSQLWNLQQLIRQLKLDQNISLLLSNINYYLTDKFNQTFFEFADQLTAKIDKQNSIENNRFSVIEEDISGININNIEIYLISKNETKLLNSKSVLDQYQSYHTIRLESFEFGPEDDYILYFKNSNYLHQNINTRIFRFNQSFDLIVFKTTETNVYQGNKVYLKTNDNKIFFESLIYQHIVIGEHQILFVEKLQDQQINQSLADIVIYEIEDTYLPLKYTNTDIDELQQILIGKMVYNQITNTQTFFDIDDVTELKRVRYYLDPQHKQEIRIPTED